MTKRKKNKKDESILDLDTVLEETAKITGGEVTNVAKMIQSLGETVSEATKIHSVLENATQFTSGATSIIDVAMLVGQKNSLESTLEYIKSMSGVLGTLSAHNYLQKQAESEGKTLSEFIYDYDESEEKTNESNIVEPARIEKLTTDEIKELVHQLQNKIELIEHDLEKIKNNSKVKTKTTNKIRVPIQRKNLHHWKITWQKVKKAWQNGEGYKKLAVLGDVSPETIADIIRAGDAGLLD